MLNNILTNDIKKNFAVILITAMFFIGCFFVALPAFAAPPPPSVTSISPSSGTTAGGTSVTITGVHFNGATAVTIGGNAAVFSVTNNNTIAATTPAGTAGAQNVAVTTPNGTGTLKAGFTYMAPTPDTTAPVITLLGTTPVNLYVGDAYSDAGATASDNIDGDITANIITVNPVNTAVAGTYTITYNVSDAAGNPATQVTRTVNVLAVIDTTPPVITLTGAAEVTLTVGGTYTELGATAVDAVDGSVTVQTIGSVDTTVVGDYTITYTATDVANNTATATRIVHVVAESTPPPPTPGPTPSPSGGGVGSGTPITVTFSGQAYPGCAIEVLRKSAQDTLFQIIPTGTASIKEDGAFEISHTGLMREEYLYALRIKDKDGRKTTLSFDVNLLTQNSFTLKDILAPPTVEVKNTLLLRAEDLQIIGYAAPNNTIEVEIDGSAQKGTALADKTGYYGFATSVGPLAVGAHYARVRQVAKDGKKSDWSQTKSFKKSLLLALKADFNSDGKVNITDWSIFLFRWGSPDQKLRSTVDLDGNGKIDVIDLSIFLKTIQL